MNAIKGLLSSEKGLAFVLLVAGATILAAVGKMSVAEWREYSLWALGIYTGGKSIQGAAAAIANGKSQKAVVTVTRPLPEPKPPAEPKP